MVNIVTGAGETGAALVDAGRRQDRVHRLDRGRQDHPPRDRRQREAPHARARREGREHRVRGRAARPGRRGRGQRHLLQPGARVLRGLAPARAGAGVRRRCSTSSRTGCRRCASGDPLDKNTDIGAINSRAQLDKITELVAVGRRRGRRDLPARLRAARARVLVPADAVHGRLAVAPHRARGDLRAGALDPHVPHARGGRREGEQHAVRALGRDLDREGLADPVDGRPPAGRRRVGEHVQPVRSRRRRSAATRRAGSAARADCTASSRTSSSTGVRDERRAPAREAHGEAVHRRGVPAERVGPHVRGGRARRTAARARGAGLAEGPPRGGGGRARRAARVGRR